MTDNITIIRSRYLRLAKKIYADGRIEAYDQAKTIDLFEEPVSDLLELGHLLERLLSKPSCAAVFGNIADQTRIRGVRRLAYPDPETGDLPSLVAVEHQWCALDMDGIDRPEDVPGHDLARCAAEAVRHLPASFQVAQCIVQASASHGIKPGCRLRLWFWLSRATSGAELGVWLKPYPVDPCTFRPAQPIFTAAPVFVGRRDHLSGRIAHLPGAAFVEVPSPETLKPPQRVARPAGLCGAVKGDTEAFIARILERVRSATDNMKHYTLRDQARLLGGIQAEVGFSDAEAVRWLLDALPGTASDLIAAKGTAEWGLDVGRAAPISISKEKPAVSDPRRKAMARAAFRLLRMEVPSDVLLATLQEMNEQLAEPLAAEVVAKTALWAARQGRGQLNAR